MVKFKLILLSLVLLLMPTLMFADKGVVLLLKNDRTLGFAFSEMPTIIIGPQLSIKTSRNTVSYSYSDVQRIYFDDVQASDIKIITTHDQPNITFHISGDVIEVKGMTSSGTVTVFTMEGKQVLAARADNDGFVSVHIPQGKGVYIMKTSDGVSFKFITR